MRSCSGKIIIFLFLIFEFITGFAQLSTKGVPYSFLHKTDRIINKTEMTGVDIESLLKEDKLNADKNLPFRFGKVFDVNLNPENSGTLEISEKGDKLWLLEIYSPQAFSIGLFFDKFKLPDGAELYIYSSNREYILGALTSANNKSFSKLAVRQIKTDRIIVEYFQPGDCSFDGELSISNIIHDYKNEIDLEKGAKDCHINVNCAEGIGWENQKNAVCRIQFLGLSCSGSLINNTANDGRPFFLTARHCINTEQQAQATVFYFNYETESCSGEYGNETNTTSGSTLKASPRSNEYDFSLLEMSEYPPNEFKPYFAGWNSEEIPAEMLTGIHHPAGGVKKISIDNDPPVEATGQFEGFDFLPNGHWKMIAMERGFYEQGSSGSSTFNQDKQIVGILSAVTYDNCDYPFHIYAAKFCKAWDWTDDRSQSLKYWLDPENTGKTSINGYSPIQYLNDIAVKSVSGIHETYCMPNTKVNPTFTVTNNGTDIIESFNLTIALSENIIYNKRINKSLKIRESYDVFVKDILPEIGFNSLKVYVSLGENLIDENPANDTLDFYININQDLIPIEFNFISENIGKNSSWELTDTENKIVYSGGPYPEGQAIDIKD